MSARALLRFDPARLHVPIRPCSKSFISPTYRRLARNFFVSPTYAKTGGVPPTEKCRLVPSKAEGRADIFFLSSPNPRSRPSCFSNICALFHFPYPTYLSFFPYLPHSFSKNRGCTPSFLSVHIPFTILLPRLHPSFAPACHNGGQSGDHTTTMPTVNTRPTVHFYRCDPLREIRS